MSAPRRERPSAPSVVVAASESLVSCVPAMLKELLLAKVNPVELARTVRPPPAMKSPFMRESFSTVNVPAPVLMTLPEPARMPTEPSTPWSIWMPRR